MKKNSIIKFRVSNMEKEKIESKAQEMGMSVGQYARFVSLKIEIELNGKEPQKGYNVTQKGYKY